MALLYADEHFPAQAVDELRRLGHDVRTIQEDGQAGFKWPDSEVLKRATELDRVVLTLNRRDFIRLHGQNPNHSGIIACTQNLEFRQLADQIHKAITDEPTLAGHLIRVYRSQASG
jgi:predicted nuclease of predicted toxin-antitoxin system